MLESATRNALRESWKLAASDPNALTERFYGRLFEAAPGVRGLFPTEMRDQRRKLAETLDTVVSKLDDLNTVIIEVTALGERHEAYGAEPEHYPVVGEALVGAMKEQLGDAFTAEHEAAWVEVYGILSDLMIKAQTGAAV